jgi:hypothetical protein
MSNLKSKHDILSQISSNHDILRLLVHRSHKLPVKSKKTQKTQATPLPNKSKISPSSKSPNSPRGASPSQSSSKFPTIKSPISINSVEFPINYYDQLANFVLPEVSKAQKRPTFHSVNPRVSNDLKSHKISEAGIIEFKPEFPKVYSKPCILRKNKKTSEFSSNVDFRKELAEKFKKILPAYQPARVEEGKVAHLKHCSGGNFNPGMNLAVEVQDSERKRPAKTSRLKQHVREIVKEDDSSLEGWSFIDQGVD